MSRSEKTALNVVIVSLASLGQIVNQFLFFRVNTYTFGATAETDPLFFALNLTTVLAAVVTGSIAYVLVPELVSQFDDTKDGNGKSGWQLASFVGLLTFAVCSLVGILVYAFAEPLCYALMEENVPGQALSAASYLRIMTINFLLMGMVSWAAAVLHSRHSFFFAALGGVLGTGLQLAFLVQAPKTIEMIAWAIVFGSAVSLLIHMLPLLTKLRWPKANYASLSKLLVAFWPLMLGAAFLRLDPLVNQSWVSELEEGWLTLFHYAFRIMMALLTIGTSSLALVAFPQLSERYAADGNQGFAEHFALCLRRMILLIQPIAVGVSCFAILIVSDLLEGRGGEFTHDDSQDVGWLVAYLMGMFVGASLAELFSRGFYVLNDTKTPTAIGVVCLVVGLAVKYALFKSVGIWGIALGISFYYVVTSMVLGGVLARKVSTTVFSGALRYVVDATVAALLACGCCYLVYANSFGGTLVAAPVGVAAYGIALLVLRNEEVVKLTKSVLQKRSS